MTIYSNRLAHENEEDVLSALEKIAELPRKEYEPAIPDIGTVLAMVEVARTARLNRQNADVNKKLFYFTCDTCGFSESGYFVPSDPKAQKRICGSRYGHSHGTICGHDMRIDRFVPMEEACPF